jgi:SAM-dependent methyltransferase
VKDSKERFSRTVEDYAKYRPSYPPALIDWLVEDFGKGTRVADIGCGTGISTRLFAARGLDVVGVEPNDAMRRAAEAFGGGPRYVKGQAEATSLPPRSVDLAVAAQAFHWFDVEKTLGELSRILAPEGRCAAFWNVRADTPFLRDYDALLRRNCKDYHEVPEEEATIARIRAATRVRAPTGAEFPNEQRLDWPGFLGRARSASYVSVGLRDPKAFEKDMRKLFDFHERGGFVEFVYRSVAVAWSL